MDTSTQIKSKNNKNLDMSKIGIIYNTDHKTAFSVAENLENILKSKGFSGIQTFAISGKQKNHNFQMPDITMAFIIGGDGTFLGASRFFASKNIPLFGINTGRLGFLSQLLPCGMESGIDKIINGDFSIEERLMIKSSAEKGDYKTALNDVVIKGGDVSRTMQLFLYINDKHVCDYIADGLIISTPTGSTAYTLSAGGPVVVPELEAFVIVPICPHTLTTRPIVIPANEKLTVKINSDAEFVYVTSDGQENVKILGKASVEVEKYEHKALLIQIEESEDNGFYGLLRKKLHWGVSPKA
jgi:NAD+ kinase